MTTKLTQDKNWFQVTRRMWFAPFKQCFPGKNNLTDVDGFIERNGFYLYKELKSEAKQLDGSGQRMALRRRSEDGISLCLMLEGDGYREYRKLAAFWRGWFYDWKPTSLEEVVELDRVWNLWTKTAKTNYRPFTFESLLGVKQTPKERDDQLRPQLFTHLDHLD